MNTETVANPSPWEYQAEYFSTGLSMVELSGSYMVTTGTAIDFFDNPIDAAKMVLESQYNDLNPFDLQMKIANMKPNEVLKFFDVTVLVELIA